MIRRLDDRLAELFDELSALDEPSRRERLGELERTEPDCAPLLRRLLDNAQEDSFLGPEQLRFHVQRVRVEQLGRVDGYVLRRPLGEGGMGIVYEAQAPLTGRTVALKIMRFHAPSALALARFRDEVRRLEQLSHANIVRVLHASTFELDGHELPYFTMELVNGRPIDAFDSLPIPRRLELILQLCDAVVHAHAHAVLHRDLKPANLLVTERRGELQLKVLDFGLAAVTSDEPTGAVGTLAYMSPEQTRPAPVSLSSDQYALGTIAYRMLSGAHPLALDGLSPAEMRAAIREHEPAPLRQRAPEVPGDVARIIHKALEKDPERRYATVAELTQDLRRARLRRPISLRRGDLLYRAGLLLRRRPLASALGVAAVAIAVSFLHRYNERRGVHQGFLIFAEMLVNARVDSIEAGGAIAGNMDVFEQMARELVEEQPRSVEARGLLARCLALSSELLLRSGDLEAAEQKRRQAVRLQEEVVALAGGPEAKELLAHFIIKVGDCQKERGRLGDARARYEAARKIHGDLVREFPDVPHFQDLLAWSHLRLADLYFKLEREEEALAELVQGEEHLRRLLQRDPENSEYLMGRVQVLALRSNWARERHEWPAARAVGDECLALVRRLRLRTPDSYDCMRYLLGAYSCVLHAMDSLDLRDEWGVLLNEALAEAQEYHRKIPLDTVALAHLTRFRVDRAEQLRREGDTGAAWRLVEEAIADCRRMQEAQPTALAGLEGELRGADWMRLHPREANGDPALEGRVRALHEAVLAHPARRAGHLLQFVQFLDGTTTPDAGDERRGVELIEEYCRLEPRPGTQERGIVLEALRRRGAGDSWWRKAHEQVQGPDGSTSAEEWAATVQAGLKMARRE